MNERYFHKSIHEMKGIFTSGGERRMTKGLYYTQMPVDSL